jgi:hypothetical protein
MFANCGQAGLSFNQIRKQMFLADERLTDNTVLLKKSIVKQKSGC